MSTRESRNRLSGIDVEAALYCVRDLIERRRDDGIQVPPWMIEHLRELDLTSARSGCGHVPGADSEECDEESLIDTRAAAAILGCTERHVRRLANDLDGQRLSGGWAFKLNAISDYAQGRNQPHG